MLVVELLRSSARFHSRAVVVIAAPAAIGKVPFYIAGTLIVGKRSLTVAFQLSWDAGTGPLQVAIKPKLVQLLDGSFFS